MKRLIELAILVAAAVFVLRRLGMSVALGFIVLDDKALSERAGDPLDMIVLGIADFPSGTSPELAASGIRRLRVVGLLQADKDVIKALSGKVMSVGAIESRDS